MAQLSHQQYSKLEKWLLALYAEDEAALTKASHVSLARRVSADPSLGFSVSESTISDIRKDLDLPGAFRWQPRQPAEPGQALDTIVDRMLDGVLGEPNEELQQCVQLIQDQLNLLWKHGWALAKHASYLQDWLNQYLRDDEKKALPTIVHNAILVFKQHQQPEGGE